MKMIVVRAFFCCASIQQALLISGSIFFAVNGLKLAVLGFPLA